MTRAVEMARGKGELAQLLADRAVVQRAIVVGERAAVAVEQFADSTRRQLAMLEGARNPLAHQRIDARRVARQHDASVDEAIARRRTIESGTP